MWDPRILGHHLLKWLATACEKALWASAATSYQHAIRFQHHLGTSLGTTASLQDSLEPNSALQLATFTEILLRWNYILYIHGRALVAQKVQE